MGKQIIKQPDGKYAVWETGVDDFTMIDATPKDIIEAWVEEFRQNATRSVNETVQILEDGGKPYRQFTHTWEETLAWYETVHGCKFDLDSARKEVLSK